MKHDPTHPKGTWLIKEDILYGGEKYRKNIQNNKKNILKLE